ncbi:uncharacterized protein IUM83_02653 [Phytophthora cinnamomi]|uniref:uncharacterized protein n=1 Tax=Phytophthora cinnamomi TaxID=4785 RepID=UPI003559BE7F|nr:hypothetical protein IUM83_02653 [Phytophthora cinnamomi]
MCVKPGDASCAFITARASSPRARTRFSWKSSGRMWPRLPTFTLLMSPLRLLRSASHVRRCSASDEDVAGSAACCARSCASLNGGMYTPPVRPEASASGSSVRRPCGLGLRGGVAAASLRGCGGVAASDTSARGRRGGVAASASASSCRRRGFLRGGDDLRGLRRARAREREDAEDDEEDEDEERARRRLERERERDGLRAMAAGLGEAWRGGVRGRWRE